MSFLDLKRSYASLSHDHDSDYSALVHNHVEADITDLQSYSLSSHNHNALYANISHNHVKADITDFSHTHVEADITDLQSYSLTSHTHTYNISDVEGWIAPFSQSSGGISGNQHIVLWDTGTSKLYRYSKVDIQTLPSTRSVWIHDGSKFVDRLLVEADISDLQSYSLTSHNHTLDGLSNVTITSIVSGEILKWNGTAWINNTLSEAGISATHSHPYAATSHTHVEADITDLQSYSLTSHTHAINDLSDVTITSVVNDEILGYSGGWINRTLAEAGISATSHSHAHSSLTGIGTSDHHVKAISSDMDFDDIANANSHSEQIKAGFSIHGGGNITVDSSFRFGWTSRLIVIANGRGSHFGTSGYFDINAPTSGVITAVGGGTANTWNSSGIVIPSWQALYYILPIGSGNSSVAANFRMVSYTSDLEIPDHWIRIASKNGDNSVIQVCVGLLLNDSENFLMGTQSLVGQGPHILKISGINWLTDGQGGDENYILNVTNYYHRSLHGTITDGLHMDIGSLIPREPGKTYTITEVKVRAKNSGGGSGEWMKFYHDDINDHDNDAIGVDIFVSLDLLGSWSTETTGTISVDITSKICFLKGDVANGWTQIGDVEVLYTVS